MSLQAHPERAAAHQRAPSTDPRMVSAWMHTLYGAIRVHAFDDTTGLAIGIAVRCFDSFAVAAHEAGQSRIYGDIHVPCGNRGRRALGEYAGAKVIERLGTPSGR